MPRSYSREAGLCSHQPRSRHLGRGARGWGWGAGPQMRDATRSGPHPAMPRAARLRAAAWGPRSPGCKRRAGKDENKDVGLPLAPRGHTGLQIVSRMEKTHWVAAGSAPRGRGGGQLVATPRTCDPQCLDSLLRPGRRTWRRGL